MEDFTNFICFQLGASARKIQNYYNNLFKPYGITLGQSFILMALLQREGLNIGGLAEKLMLDNSALTGLVDRLEKEDLVQRRVDPEDRRAYLIYMTDKGRELAHTVYALVDQFNQQLRGMLGEEQQEGIKLLLKSLS
ncbi:MAG TPA: MarR family transcriptional regulator [Syntrophomonadaceae bacterium]|nr:MarR family transcriptional regulator [Syntrophomonadaceae bacterium]